MYRQTIAIDYICGHFYLSLIQSSHTCSNNTCIQFSSFFMYKNNEWQTQELHRPALNVPPSYK